MDRWEKKTAVVTGAVAGIGAACVIDLAKAGMIVAALDIQEARFEELKNRVPEEFRKNVYPLKCNVSVEEDVIQSFKWIQENLGPVHVLVNNAGIVRNTNLTAENNTSDILAVLNTNVMAVVYCVREAFQQMSKNNINGHVVILNSITGHIIPYLPGHSMNMYPPSKHAVTAMVEVLRQEFANAGTNIKVTSISPGTTDTEIVPEEIKKRLQLKMIRPEDVSNAIVYCISTPPNVQIHELTIKPLHEKI